MYKAKLVLEKLEGIARWKEGPIPVYQIIASGSHSVSPGVEDQHVTPLGLITPSVAHVQDASEVSFACMGVSHSHYTSKAT